MALSIDTPPAPSGFTWHTAKNGVGTFLKPDGWYVLEETKGNTNAIFISRENIKKHGKFIIGFSVNRITSYSSDSSIKASEYAKVFIQQNNQEAGSNYKLLKRINPLFNLLVY